MLLLPLPDKLDGPSQSELQDTFGRRFTYLRVSITDACNFKCGYCLPSGYRKPCASETQAFLSPQEIENAVSAFAELGTVKVRLTGGEPTLRADLPEIVERVSRIAGIRSVALSTNGSRLKTLAPQLARLGLKSVNVSVDSLEPARFESVTGRRTLPEILEGIETALETGLLVKLNAVLLPGLEELDRFSEWIKDRSITVRFIELMRTGTNGDFFSANHVKADVLKRALHDRGWKPRLRGATDGPALEFEHPESVGRIGIIAPYSKDFCSTCNRLRLTSQGGLRLCLFGESDHSLRPLLSSSHDKDRLKAEIRSLIGRKEISHYLPQGIYGNNQTFSAIGG